MSTLTTSRIRPVLTFKFYRFAGWSIKDSLRNTIADLRGVAW